MRKSWINYEGTQDKIGQRIAKDKKAHRAKLKEIRSTESHCNDIGIELKRTKERGRKRKKEIEKFSYTKQRLSFYLIQHILHCFRYSQSAIAMRFTTHIGSFFFHFVPFSPSRPSLSFWLCHCHRSVLSFFSRPLSFVRDLKTFFLSFSLILFVYIYSMLLRSSYTKSPCFIHCGPLSPSWYSLSSLQRRKTCFAIVRQFR